MTSPELAVGFSRLSFHSADPDQQRFVETCGRELLPRLREASG